MPKVERWFTYPTYWRWALWLESAVMGWERRPSVVALGMVVIAAIALARLCYAVLTLPMSTLNAGLATVVMTVVIVGCLAAVIWLERGTPRVPLAVGLGRGQMVLRSPWRQSLVVFVSAIRRVRPGFYSSVQPAYEATDFEAEVRPGTAWHFRVFPALSGYADLVTLLRGGTEREDAAAPPVREFEATAYTFDTLFLVCLVAVLALGAPVVLLAPRSAAAWWSAAVLGAGCGIVVPLLSVILQPSGLTITPSGIRVRYPRGETSIPWSEVTSVREVAPRWSLLGAASRWVIEARDKRIVLGPWFTPYAELIHLVRKYAPAG